MSDTNKIAELLPCPWCGEVPAVNPYYEDQPEIDSVYVWCRKCDFGPDRCFGVPKIEAIIAWNTRTQHGSDALREAATKARDYLRSGVPAEYSPDEIFIPLDAALSTSGDVRERALREAEPDFLQKVADNCGPVGCCNMTGLDVENVIDTAFALLDTPAQEGGV